MEYKDILYTSRAKDDFDKAWFRAFFSRILALLNHKSDDLLALNDVLGLLKPDSTMYLGLKTVPLALIVGSEGRYKDFNRSFLPRHSHLRTRWERIDMILYKQRPFPLISLYKIGGVYFVCDGNHRVSVAKASGVEFIDAEVVELNSKVQIKPNMDLQDLKRAVIDLEKKEFLKRTGLDKLRQSVQLNFTAPGRYDEVINHINVHKDYLYASRKNEVSFEQALLSWFDDIFKPITQVIRAEKILRLFPGRTEADLYVWMVKHGSLLKKRYVKTDSLKDAVLDSINQYGKSIKKPIRRGWFRLKNIYRKLALGLMM